MILKHLSIKKIICLRLQFACSLTLRYVLNRMNTWAVNVTNACRRG